MNTTITRRRFIQGNLAAALAAAAFPSIIPASALGREGKTAPSERVVVGCIGNGPQGRGVMGNFLGQSICQVVAVCDVYKTHLEMARKQVNDHYHNNDCATHHEFEGLLARKDIDAVLIATPDHWHVPVALAAARAQKDMYLEKPMGLSIQEDRLLRKAIQKNKRVFQFGTQQRSSSQFRQACELVRHEKIGKLKNIYVWSAASQPGGSTKPGPVPEGLDYERWLGPAPQSQHTEGRCVDTPPSQPWKTWWYNYDYALGFIAGWGVHPLDIALWGYPEMMSAPFDIEGKAMIPKEGACNTSVAWDVQFTFASGVRMFYRGTRNGLEEENEMNNLKPWADKFGHLVDHGTVFEGTEGWVVVDRTQIRANPEKLLEEKPDPNAVRLIESSNHARNFLEAVQKRGQAICPIEDSVEADILCHVSDIATRVGRKLTWDPLQETFLKNKDANQRLKIRSTRVPYAIK